MKKLLIIYILLLSPAYALCSIEEGASVCSLSNVREEFQPTYSGNYPIGVQPSTELQPIKRKDPIEDMRTPNNRLNYNSSCQFGVCVQEPVKYSEMLNE